MKEQPKLQHSRFEHLFLRYGAGSHVFLPLTRYRFWNRICWAVIVLGVIGWICGLWFLSGYAE